MTHLPPLWKFRLLRKIRAKGVAENRRLLDAWQRAEGGHARWNPLNTTEPWPRSSTYNSAGVRKYFWPGDGIAATAATLTNGRYNGIVAGLRGGTLTAKQIVEQHGLEFDTWGTGAANVLRLL